VLFYRELIEGEKHFRRRLTRKKLRRQAGEAKTGGKEKEVFHIN
jgi:hypothetical protein